MLLEATVTDTHFQGVAFSLSTLYNMLTRTFALMSGHFKAGEPSSNHLQLCFQEILAS